MLYFVRRLIILVIKKVIALLLLVLMLANLSLTVFAEEEILKEDNLNEEISDEDYTNEPCTPFVLMASDENGYINISCSKVEYFGNLSSAKHINIWSSDIKENGLKNGK